MKKGQITIFIIVGLVVLLAVGFGMYIITMLDVEEPVIATNVDVDASRCLQQVSERALQSLAQRDTTSDVIVLADGSIVRVGVKDSGEPLGRYTLQNLCLRGGLNAPNAAGDNTNSCFAGTYQRFEPNEQVLQYQLQEHIAREYAVLCGGEVTVAVIFSGDSVTVSTANATTTIPVRFKRIYNAASMIARAEVLKEESDLSDVTSVYGCDEPAFSNECILPGMIVSTRMDAEATIVQVSDTQSIVNSEPLTYQFAILNRYPVITAPIEVSVPTAAEDGSTTTTTIPVHAFDPDDEPLEITCDTTATCTPDAILVTPTACESSQDVVLTYKACGRTCAEQTITLHYEQPDVCH
jgi:hypothetical protein